MTPHTTYTVKSRKDNFVWQFKYDLNGHLTAFKILNSTLTGKQMKWLFSGSNFAANESIMKTVWIPQMRKHFDIEVGEPDFSFEAFWKLYGLKRNRKRCETLWKKLSKGDQIKAIKAIKGYEGYLSRKKYDKMLPDTYLRNRSFEDEFNAIH